MNARVRFQLEVMWKSFVFIRLCLSWSCPEDYSLCLQGFFFFFSWSWHVECQRGQGCQRPFLYQVIAPVWSLPLGQCAAHISSNWLTVRMPLPWNMSSWGKRDPPPLPLLSSFQAGFACWESSGGKHAMCVYLFVIEACAHAYWEEMEVPKGRMGFWGYRGSRASYCAAMCVRACAGTCMQLSVGVHAWLFGNGFLL